MKKIVIGSVIAIFILIVVLIATIYLLFPTKYSEYVEKYSEEYNLDKSLVYSVIKIESGFKKDSLSKAGAMGLMQILPSTGKDMAIRLKMSVDDVNLYDPQTNIKIGCYYLSYLLNLYDGNVVNTLCAYNWGLSNVNNWISKGNVDDSGTITSIPVKETKNYITKYKVSKWIYCTFYRI